MTGSRSWWCNVVARRHPHSTRSSDRLQGARAQQAFRAPNHRDRRGPRRKTQQQARLRRRHLVAASELCRGPPSTARRLLSAQWYGTTMIHAETVGSAPCSAHRLWSQRLRYGAADRGSIGPP